MISKYWPNVLTLIFAFPLWTRLCRADVTQTFRWSFTDSSQEISPLLTECQNLKINLLPVTNGTVTAPPPYYLMAFEPEGISTTTFVGTNYSDLTWQVNHAAGTKLMLSMGDGDGNSGGIPNAMYTVVAGTNSSCLPSAPSSNLTITANVTKDLSTCEPWGLTVTGGVEPYNITLAALDSTLVTNVTLPIGYDVFTYIDRANPNGQMLAAVSDSSGKFGKTTTLVNTVGSTNVDCTGLVSKAGNSTQISAAASAAAAADKISRSKHRKTVIAAVCATVSGLIIITGVILFVLWWRRKHRGIQDGQDTLPRVFKEDTIDSPESFALSPSSSSHKQQMLEATPGSLADGSLPIVASRTLMPPPGIVQSGSNAHDPSSQQHAQASSSNPNSPNHGGPASSPGSSSPTAPISPLVFDTNGRHAKTRARSRSARSTDGSVRRAGSANASSHPIPPLPNRPFTAGSQPLDPDTEPDIIIQHRDGGIVQELPPPYLDHRDSDRDRRPSQPSPPPPPSPLQPPEGAENVEVVEVPDSVQTHDNTEGS